MAYKKAAITHSIIPLARKPTQPAPNATKIQNVPALPALDFLAISHMIKNKKPMNIGSKPYRPSLTIVPSEMANSMVVPPKYNELL